MSSNSTASDDPIPGTIHRKVKFPKKKKNTKSASEALEALTVPSAEQKVLVNDGNNRIDWLNGEEEQHFTINEP